MTGHDINGILGISESFMLPDRLMSILLSEDRNRIMNEFMLLGESLDHDWFTAYFEEEHSNKSRMAQDFTPNMVANLAAELLGKAECIADVCAGTGGLTIAAWLKNPDAYFECFEVSIRAIPLLLLNLCLRNIRGKVTRCDILTGETFETFEISPGERFSSIKRTEKHDPIAADAVIANPPYSLKYKPVSGAKKYFGDFAEILPTNFADYCFIAYGLNLCKDGANLVYILPHGVLFRGGKEEACRKLLVQNGWLNAIIGLPDKLFENTDIPTCIIKLVKQQSNGSCMFVDAEKECKKEGKINKIRESDKEKILNVIRSGKNTKISHIADLDEMMRNNYNLNIPRYVSTFEPEPPVDIESVMRELMEIHEEEEKIKKALAFSLNNTVAQNASDRSAVRLYIQYLEGEKHGNCIKHAEQMQFNF